MLYFIPTDTCYWMGCAWDDAQGFERIYDLKNRSKDKPLSIVVDDFSDLSEMVTISPDQIDFLRKYPFPFTLLAPRNPSLILPAHLSRESYALLWVRVGSVCLSDFVRSEIPFPLFLTSANKSGQGETYSLLACKEIFSGQILPADLRIDMPCPIRPASNIFSFIADTTVLRFTRELYH